MLSRPLLSDGLVTLRPFLQSDAPLLYAAVCESLDDLKPWMSWANVGYSRQDAQSWVETAIERWIDETYFGFAVCDAAQSTFWGGCSISHIHPVYFLCNLGYWVRTARRGQGIAARATRLVARYAFEYLGVVRTEIVIGVGNNASIRVAEKAGAHYEGILRNRMVVRDLISDAVMFSLVPADFGLAVKKQPWVDV